MMDHCLWNIMEEELDSGEFWLPPEFLVKELLMEEDDSSYGPGSDGSVFGQEDDSSEGLQWKMGYSKLTKKANKSDPSPMDKEKKEISKQQPILQKVMTSTWGRKTLLNNRTSKELGIYSGPLGLPSSAWPPLQQPKLKQQQREKQYHLPGPKMRAVFLGSSATRKESVGTGVFLPRQVGSPIYSLSKPAGLTVLIPARVVEALNLKLEETGHVRRSETDSSLGRIHVTQHSHTISSRDACLPPEWTY